MDGRLRIRSKPYYNPPILLARQAISAFYFAKVIGWRKLPQWLLKLPRTLRLSSGALGMGCIGFPIHPVWEVTSACNLNCKHCHASGGRPTIGELTTEEGKNLIRQIAAINEFRMLVLSGGEPLVRPDIIELISHASALGLEISVATNATLITPEMASRLKRAGAVNMAIGLDGASEKTHDTIRSTRGSFKQTMRGIESTKDAGLALQINITMMKHNYHEIPALLDMAHELGADIVLLYNLVPEGRGRDGEIELSRDQFKDIIEFVSKKQRSIVPIVEPTCSPQYWAFLMSKLNGNGNGHGERKPGRLATLAFKGCAAGNGICYVKPDGEVWPCPFVQVSGGNIRNVPLKEIWESSEVFVNLKTRDNLKGECGRCINKSICGGCRGRAFAHYGDYLQEDPFCFLKV